MVMIFSSEKALRHLLEHGEVVTFRLKNRREGRDWITDRRGGRKIADVEIRLIERVPEPIKREAAFQKYLTKSGFPSVREWLEEIMKLNGRKRFFEAKEGYLYLVRLGGDV